MAGLPEPSSGELLDALRVATTSDDPTLRELLRAVWYLTRAIHPRPVSYWASLPDLGA